MDKSLIDKSLIVDKWWIVKYPTYTIACRGPIKPIDLGKGVFKNVNLTPWLILKATYDLTTSKENQIIIDLLNDTIPEYILSDGLNEVEIFKSGNYIIYD